jgi:hypothetical protein
VEEREAEGGEQEDEEAEEDEAAQDASERGAAPHRLILPFRGSGLEFAHGRRRSF